MESVQLWDGNEWQRWCMRLIRLTYGADQVQEVPSRHGGDLGIEGFTYSGHSFQCYVIQEPADTKKRYEEQRDKLTEDISKLSSRRSEFQKLLGPVRINCYFYMLPLWNSKELVKHAATKTDEVRMLRLPFVDSDSFRIVVTDDEAFAPAKGKVLPQHYPIVSIAPADEKEARQWIRSNAGPYAGMDQKLAKVFRQDSKRRRYIESLLTKHIESGNLMEKLRERYPDQWEGATGAIRVTRSMLELEHLDSSDPPSATLVKNIADALRRDINRDAPAIDEGSAKVIAWGSVADWLIQCPLDFEYPEGG